MTTLEAIRALEDYLIAYPSFDNPWLRRAVTQAIEALQDKQVREEGEQP